MLLLPSQALLGRVPPPRSCLSPVLAPSAPCSLPLSPALAWGFLPHGWWDIHARSPQLGLRCFLRLCFRPCRSCSFLLLLGDSADAQPQPWAQLLLLLSWGRALHGARQAVGTPRAKLMLCLTLLSLTPFLLPTPALQTLLPCSACTRHCGGDAQGSLCWCQGWSLTWPCWLGTAVGWQLLGGAGKGSSLRPSSLESVWPVHPQGAPGFACGQQAQDGGSGSSQSPWWLGCPPGPGTVAHPTALVSRQELRGA